MADSGNVVNSDDVSDALKCIILSGILFGQIKNNYIFKDIKCITSNNV